MFTHTNGITRITRQSFDTGESRRGSRRGAAMLLVLAVVAITVLIAYTALSTATLAAKGAAERRRASELDVAAENGARLAMHYLTRPDLAGSLTVGAGGDAHWSGANDLQFNEHGGLTDVVVTNPEPGRFDIVSTTRDSLGHTRALHARVRRGLNDWAPMAGLQLASTTRLRSNVEVNKHVWFATTYYGGGTISGNIYASNYTTPPPGEPVPAFDTLALVQAARTDLSYVYDGERCFGQLITSPDFETLPIQADNNPGGVYFYDGMGKGDLVVNIPDNPDFKGTLVVTNANVDFVLPIKLRPQKSMPALIVEGDTKIDQVILVDVTGTVYLKGRLRGMQSMARLRVHGSVLSATTAFQFAAYFSGSVGIEYCDGHGAAPRLVAGSANAVTVEQWDLE